MPSERHIVRLRVETKRSGSRVVVELSDGESFEIDPEIAVARGLKSGAPIDDATVEQLRREDESLRARRRLVHYLALRVKSVADARIYLEKAGFSEAAIAGAIEHAREHDLLDNRRFAERFVRSKLKTAVYGPLRLLADLLAHGVEPSLAEEVLRPQFDLDWQRRAAESFARKRLAAKAAAGEDTVRKLRDALERRGFEHEIAREIAERLG